MVYTSERSQLHLVVDTMQILHIKRVFRIEFAVEPQ